MNDGLKDNNVFLDIQSCQIYQNTKIQNSVIDDNVTIGEDCYLSKSHLYKGVQINRRNFILNSNVDKFTYTGINTTIRHADIGKFCSIAWNVSVCGGGARHDFSLPTTHPFTQLSSFGFVNENTKLALKRTVVGNDVWLGMHSVILPGITVGNGAVIGANSLVNKDVPDYAIVAGNPAKILRYRFSEEMILQLKEAEWWNLPEEVLTQNIDLFRKPITEDSCKKLLDLHYSINFEEKP